MKNCLSFVCLLLLPYWCPGEEFCEFPVGENVRAFVPTEVREGVPFECSVSLTNAMDVSAQFIVTMTAGATNFRSELLFPILDTVLTNSLAPGEVRRHTFTIGKEWVAEGISPDCVQFFAKAVNSVQTNAAANRFRAYVFKPEWNVYSIRSNPITRDDFPE